MLTKVILIVIVSLVLIAPAMLSDKLMPKEGFPRLPYRRPYHRWKGPKTDERINRMLQESIVLLKGLGVPISRSICPEVVLTGSRTYYGKCCPKGSLKKYDKYDFYIEISGYTLDNTEKSLRNTLIHELIHTVPGGLCHTGEWKKWAKFVSERTEYNIRRLEGDETSRDRDRLVNGGYTNWLAP